MTFPSSKAQIKFRPVMAITSPSLFSHRSMGMVLTAQNSNRGAVFFWVLHIGADRESRVMLDLYEWKLHPLVFAGLIQLWGPLEVDLFASTQLPRFYSWRPDPQPKLWMRFLKTAIR